jgi:hypothetical protein
MPQINYEEMQEILNKHNQYLTVDEIKKYQEYLEALKQEIMDETDYHVLQGKNGTQTFMVKSGYYKLKKAFGITLETVEHDIVYNEKGSIKFAWFHVRAKLPNGEISDGYSGASSNEKGKKGAGDIIGTAHTRACLRAISQLVDFGSVSFDEISNINKEVTQDVQTIKRTTKRKTKKDKKPIRHES